MFLVKQLYKEFIFGGHFQSLGAASLVFITFVIFNHSIVWPAVFLAYLLFYPLYLFNRLWELDDDATSNPERTKYFKLYVNRMPLIFILESVLTAILLFVFAKDIGIIIYGGLLYTLGILYTIYIKKLTKFFFAFKNFYVASFFAAIVPFSILFIDDTFDVKVWLLTFFVFLKGVLMQALLDIKDINSDKKEGLKTFPVVFGEKQILIFSLFFSFALSILIPWYLSKNFFPVWFLFTFFTFPFYLYIINLIKNNKYYGYILASGEYLFWVIFLFIGKALL